MSPSRIGEVYEKVIYIVGKFLGSGDQAFGFDKPSDLGYTIGDRLLNDYFSVAHFLISFLV
jgi:hypothetical protein